MGELNPGGLGELDPDAATGELGPAMGELDPDRHGGAQPQPAAPPRLAVGGGDGHGELGPGGHGGARPQRPGGARPRRGHGGARPGHGGARPRPAAAPRLAVSGGDGHGELRPGGLGELDLGVDMGELDPHAMGELNPGGLGSPRSVAATVLAVGEWLWSSTPSGGPFVET